MSNRFVQLKFIVPILLATSLLTGCASSDQEFRNDSVRKYSAVDSKMDSGNKVPPFYGNDPYTSGLFLAVSVMTTPFPSGSANKSQVLGRCVFNSDELKDAKCEGVYILVEDINAKSTARVWIDASTSEFSFLHVPGHIYKVTAFDENHGVKSETIEISGPTSLLQNLNARSSIENLKR